MRDWETMWQFETASFRIEWAITAEDSPDFSFDETGETAEKVYSGEWTCFTSRMRVIEKQTGVELGFDYLGNSIYANPAEFRDHIGARGRWGSYFRDMVHSACSEARKTLNAYKPIYIRGT